MYLKHLLGLIGLLGACLGALGQSLQLDLNYLTDSSDFQELKVWGLPFSTQKHLGNEIPSQDTWKQILPVYVGDSLPDPQSVIQPVGGNYRLVKGGIYFRPHFPFFPGQAYVAVFHRSELWEHLGLTNKDTLSTTSVLLPFSVPHEKASTYITEIYPQTDTLPANQLKLYIYFSEPMRFGEAYQHIQLQDEAGGVVQAPFLEIEQELWDHRGQRFTLWFDPGRIKRALQPHNEWGNPLLTGNTYTLTIDSLWRDATGKPLLESYQKRFFVGNADRTLPDPSAWKLVPPSAPSKEALSLHFPEPLEQPLLLRMIQVKKEAGRTIHGNIQVKPGERQWDFIPKEPWLSGNYQLEIDVRLEDLAGNNLIRLFDSDSNNEVKSPYAGQEKVVIPFTIEATTP